MQKVKCLSVSPPLECEERLFCGSPYLKHGEKMQVYCEQSGNLHLEWAFGHTCVTLTQRDAVRLGELLLRLATPTVKIESRGVDVTLSPPHMISPELHNPVTVGLPLETYYAVKMETGQRDITETEPASPAGKSWPQEFSECKNSLNE